MPPTDTGRRPGVGVLGAGRMGLPVIGHLAANGHPTVVFDPDDGKRDAVRELGATFAETPAEVAAASDTILVCVGYEEQVTSLLTCPTGVLATLRPGTVVAVLSTVTPEVVVTLSRALDRAGGHLVDAPVCRGGEAADRGELLTFIGGEAAVVERVSPVLRAYSADIVHTGAVGTAQVAKAVNNLILWACLVADHEGLALAQRHGVDVEALRAALLTSSAANSALAKWGRQTMAWAEDDMHIVARMAVDAGLSLPQAGVTREICRTLKPRRYQLEDYGR